MPKVETGQECTTWYARTHDATALRLLSYTALSPLTHDLAASSTPFGAGGGADASLIDTWGENLREATHQSVQAEMQMNAAIISFDIKCFYVCMYECTYVRTCVCVYTYTKVHLYVFEH